ncbi:MAG: ABC transporter ATP-binding protein, partial [Terrimicrobiaceae bacterium]|nr:ABC transporter ATP-binding protein [Terrimicrobiaceae bacterium]
TTLLRNIAGFYIPESGRVLFGEEDVTRLPPHQRNTGMMFQSYALWPHMTVAKNVAFGLEERKVPPKEIERRVAEALESVKMGPYASRKIGQLSGGQQQRVALARALVIRPRALLLDEPLSNLDAKLRLEMRAEIRRVCKQFGLTAIYVTHDQKEALSISDRMAILEGGRIAQIGSPEEVYRRPRSRVVADFIGETNFIEGEAQGEEAGLVVARTALGVFHGLPGEPGWRPSAGEKVTLSVRPECWAFADGAGAVNTARGRIQSAVYLGEVAQYLLDCGGHTLKVFELNPLPSARPGDRETAVAARPEDVVVLRS